jgi:large subunit ribosomal protein L25
VLYGGDQPVHFSAEEKAFKSLVYTPNAHTVVIDLGKGKSFNAIHKTFRFTLCQTNFTY